MEEELEKIEKMKEIPKEIIIATDKKVFENLIIATCIMVVCVLLLVGYRNIEPKIYFTILRVFSVIALVGTICVIEIAYKKDSGKLAINAAEAVAISIAILSLQYIYMYNIYKFPSITTFMAYICGIYYSGKGMAIMYNERKKYRKSVNDIKDITNERKK